MLPFVFGAAAGAVVVYALENRKEIKEGACKVKDVACEGVSKVKEVASDVKKSVGDTIDCIKSKKTKDATQPAAAIGENK